MVIRIDSAPGLVALFLSALASRPTLVRSGFVLPPAHSFVAAPGHRAWEISAKNVSTAEHGAISGIASVLVIKPCKIACSLSISFCASCFHFARTLGPLSRLFHWQGPI